MKALGATPLPIEAPPGTAPLGGDGLEVTWYVNRASFDIKAIKPYAAYDLSIDWWAVMPQRMPKSWGPQALSPGFWHHMATVANGVKAVLDMLPGRERDERAKLTYDTLHDERSAAYGPRGQGLFDPRSLQWVTMNRWGLLGPLEEALGRPMAHVPPAVP